MRKLIVGGAVLVTTLSMSSVAYAGEVGGNGEVVEMNARSLCAFSGLEDEPHAPGTVQNWGHVKMFLAEVAPDMKFKGANSVQTPFGEEGCNAHLYPAK